MRGSIQKHTTSLVANFRQSMQYALRSIANSGVQIAHDFRLLHLKRQYSLLGLG